LEELAERIRKCKACDLWKNRNKAVPGEGNPNAKVMLIGLGPGKSEDQQGRPFVGRAGKFLDELLELVGIERKEVFITNVAKCFLPQNKITEEQAKICTSLYLEKQIEIIDPKVIITLGDVATSYIFRKFNLPKSSITKIHGKIFKVFTLKGEKFIIPMFHPAVALYNPKYKEILKQDWLNIKSFIQKFVLT